MGRERWQFPIGGVLGFVVLYVVAAALYPGGTRDEPGRVGFSLVHNYWCDLLDQTTYAGVPNPARPIALAAMVVLCAGLAALWWGLPALFLHAPRRAMVVRAAAIGSFVAIPCVATRWHDAAVNVAGALGMLGFVCSYTALPQLQKAKLRVVTTATLLAALANYVMWQSGRGLSVMPVVQKVEFALFLCWMVRAALLLRPTLLARSPRRVE